MKKLLNIIFSFFFFTSVSFGQEMTYDEYYNGNTFSVIKIKYTPQLSSSFKLFHNKVAKKHVEIIDELLSVTSEFLLINACISDEKGVPIGLFIDEGKTILPENLGDGDGNFYLKPNGALMLKSKGPVICVSEEIALNMDADFAVQSGPMLVLKGAIHPKFNLSSTNEFIRCGVGISSLNNGVDLLVFAISNGPVNFYEFADFFLNGLNCNNALALESNGCSMYIPGRNSENVRFSGVIMNYLFLKL